MALSFLPFSAPLLFIICQQQQSTAAFFSCSFTHQQDFNPRVPFLELCRNLSHSDHGRRNINDCELLGHESCNCRETGNATGYSNVIDTFSFCKTI